MGLTAVWSDPTAIDVNDGGTAERVEHRVDAGHRGCEDRRDNQSEQQRRHLGEDVATEDVVGVLAVDGLAVFYIVGNQDAGALANAVDLGDRGLVARQGHWVGGDPAIDLRQR